MESKPLKKILFLVSEDWFFVMHRLSLAQAFIQNGYQVTLVAKPGSGSSLDKIAESGIEFIPFPFERKSLNPITEIYRLYKLKNLIRRIEPDCIFSVTLKMSLTISILSGCLGQVKIFGLITGLGYLFSANTFAIRAIRYFFSRIGRMFLSRIFLIFENPDDRRLFLDRRLAKEEASAVVPGTGVDLSEFRWSPIPSYPPFRILYSGRLLREKGILEMEEAFQVFRKKYPQSELHIIGKLDPGNPGSLTTRDLERWESTEGIVYHGFQSQVLEFYQSCHCFCLLSYYREGLPVSALEAGSVGRPLVLTDTVGCREAVKPGKNGFLVPLGNREEVVKAWTQLIESPGMCQEMGKQSRIYMEERFDRKKINAIILKLVSG
jgi:glycosyltransferase involved in cell wall biosynthesis